jgi:nitrous oxidase accessory protein
MRSRLPNSVRALLVLLFASLPLQAAEWMVNPGETIAAAIAKAQPGDTVSVQRGFYQENLVIDKPLVLRGIDRPTLSGGQNGDTIRVKASDVIIEGFIVRDSGIDLTAQNAGIYVQPGADRPVIRANQIVCNLFGAWVEGVKDPKVSGNVIAGRRDLRSADRGNNIQLYNTTGAIITDNLITFGRDGIYVDVSHRATFRNNRIHHARYGTHYMNSYHNLWENNEVYFNRGGLALMEVKNQVVRNNRAWRNEDHGIMLRTIQDSVIENNVVAGNGKGFFIYDAEYNVLRNNLVANNRIGVHLAAGSIHNDVDGNDFIHNQEQIKFVATRDEPWGKQKGNYWSNYQGWDAGGDGVGDIPYEASDMVDRLMWKHPVVKLLLNSPAVQTLRFVARQFPVLRAPSVVDAHPRMQPSNVDWQRWVDVGSY